VLLTFLWLNFLALWLRVYRITVSSEVIDSALYLGRILSAYGLLVTVWIFHNNRIQEKKGPRRTTRSLSYTPIHDALQNYVSLGIDVRRSQEIVISVRDGRKIFAARKTLHGTVQNESEFATSSR
jgi:hypothetical protein